MKSLRVAALAIALLSGAAPLAAQMPDLPVRDVDRLLRGDPVQVLTPVPGSPWPRSTVYQMIDATPEECAAVLADYELQAKYIPKTNSSRIVRRNGPDTDVEYVISIPVYPDERSVSRQRVVVSGVEYRVEWKTVVDSQAKGSVTTGSASFRATTNRSTGRVATLMIHDQAVVPASMFARVPLVRNKAIEASRDIAAAIRKQVEHEVTSDRPRLHAQLLALRAIVVRADSAKSPPH